MPCRECLDARDVFNHMESHQVGKLTNKVTKCVYYITS
jgi:hypothetical protein